MGENKSSPMERLWHACLLLLGAAIVLKLAVELIRPHLPWIVAVLAVAGALWVVLRIARWRRSRW